MWLRAKCWPQAVHAASQHLSDTAAHVRAMSFYDLAHTRQVTSLTRFKDSYDYAVIEEDRALSTVPMVVCVLLGSG